MPIIKIQNKTDQLSTSNNAVEYNFKSKESPRTEEKVINKKFSHIL